MMSRTLWTIVAVCAAIGLGGCEQTRGMLGLNKRSPDEFAVYSRAPLSLPPNYGLRPPEPGSDRPNLVMPRDEAQSALTGTRAAPRQPVSRVGPDEVAVMALLRDLRANEADPNIRVEVDRETSVLAAESRTFTDKLIFWRDPEPYGEAVDPGKETKRIQEAKALGQPLNKGDVPIISRKKRSLLEGIF
ncbi:DUF3035 domain-containing protein [Shumkonia mesophila]|uniref:DUF3035 domain-containing protein n=1 Tax=Shumkonia mesophila TaxID=2838854 RepID=UPI002934201D|nr:DUF3035 domain-containing protein [Shumkonia mesophila]